MFRKVRFFALLSVCLFILSIMTACYTPSVDNDNYKLDVDLTMALANTQWTLSEGQIPELPTEIAFDDAGITAYDISTRKPFLRKTDLEITEWQMVDEFYVSTGKIVFTSLRIILVLDENVLKIEERDAFQGNLIHCSVWNKNEQGSKNGYTGNG